MSPAKMGGRRPSLTDEQAIELMKLRHALQQLPTVEELAVRWNKPAKVIRRYLSGDPNRLPKRHEHLLHADHS